jgi:hypothetical protein
LPKRYFTGQDKALLEDFSKFANSSLKRESRGDLRRTLLNVRKSYQNDCGGENNLSQSQRDLIDSICWLTLIEHLVGTSALKFGMIKLNRSTGKISLQPVLEKNLVPLISAKRLLIKTLSEISRNGAVQQTDHLSFIENSTEEENLAAIVELEGLMPTQPDNEIYPQIQKIMAEYQKKKSLEGAGEGSSSSPSSLPSLVPPGEEVN